MSKPNFKNMLVTSFFEAITDEASRKAARAELLRRNNRHWLALLDENFPGPAKATPRVVVQVAKGTPRAKAQAKGIGSRGGNVLRGMAGAIATAKGVHGQEHFNVRTVEYNRLVALLASDGVQAIRDEAKALGLVIAKGATIAA